MALRRRTGARFEANAWAGFVDAMTALLMVMIFILSVFMIMQFFLRETIGRQAGELDNLSAQIADISEVLGATRQARDAATAEAEDKEARLAQLQFEFDQKTSELASFEEQVAALLARNTTLAEQNEQLNEDIQEMGNLEQLEIALANARSELDAQKEQARKAAAQADALEAMVASLKQDTSDGSVGLDEDMRASMAQVMALASIANLDEDYTQSPEGVALLEQVEALSQFEREQLSDQIALEFLREKLANADDELNAMTLSLEEERRKAEDQLTLIAALDQERTAIEDGELSEAEKQAALLEIARREIAVRDEVSEADARRIALLNQQTADLRAQLGALQGLLDAQLDADENAQVEIAAMGQNLNAALARVAAVQKNRADDLESYRSEFFGRLREVLAGVDGVEIVGDRFVFSSEVLFPPGGAQLSEEGFIQIGQIAGLINNLSSEIPSEINWILRVDGHTDVTPISASGQYRDNWELSQARALSVVRLMVDLYGVDPQRLAAAGFGEFHPIDTGRSASALARNRRIELKLTEQ